MRRWKQYGSTDLPARPSLAQRLWTRVQKEPGPCWEWTGALTQGYGSIRDGRRAIYTHRLAYELLVGPIDEGLHIDHLCRNTRCVNPDHLEPVAPGVNILRGIGPTAVNKRKRICKRGHPLTPDNVQINSRGYRNCRACGRVAKGQPGSPRRTDVSAIGPLHGPRRPRYPVACKWGHPWTEASAYYEADGRRRCLICRGRPGVYMSKRTHCPQGHPYSGDNLVSVKRGRRCRACHNAEARAATRRRREAAS